MPCTYYTPAEEEAIARKELNKATRSACEALKMLESLSPAHMRALSSSTLVWWKEHKERDVLRRIERVGKKIDGLLHKERNTLRKARKPKKASSKKKASKTKRQVRPKKVSRESLDKFVTHITEGLNKRDRDRW